jgi:hypothetical protein
MHATPLHNLQPKGSSGKMVVVVIGGVFLMIGSIIMNVTVESSIVMMI